jgi:hypothetical protein
VEWDQPQSDEVVAVDMVEEGVVPEQPGLVRIQPRHSVRVEQQTVLVQVTVPLAVEVGVLEFLQLLKFLKMLNL